jgi:hypothetical protein
MKEAWELFERAYLLRERERERASLLEELVLKKIYILRNSLLFRLRPSIYRDLYGLSGPFPMSHDIILLVDIYWRDLAFMTRYLMRSCIYDKISWISHPKCQLFIGQKIYEDSFIFHVIYFNFILSFLLKNKITHGEIWLVENLCFYRCPIETSSLTFKTSGHVSKNIVERVLYFWLKFNLIILDFHNT